MRVLWVEVRDFRNHPETAVEMGPGLTVLVGPNGQGKTNLLEAVHYLLTLSSPRTAVDQPLIRQGAAAAFLRGEVETAGGRVLVEVEVRPSGANRVLMNRSGIRRKRDLRHRVRSVFLIPEDLAIVQGDPTERRRYMDECAVALWPAREGERRAYDRALRQRNRLLKESEPSGPPPDLDAWDAELVRYGVAVTAGRGEAVERVRPAASQAFSRLAGADALGIVYRPSVEGDDLEAAFREMLATRRGDELLRRTTLVGPHRDELRLTVDARESRRFASHGEAWGAALSLRIGQARAVAAEIDEPPVVLLDDPFSGLDPERRRRLARSLARGEQALLAVPDEAQVPDGVAVWEVSDGRVAPR